MKVSMPTGSSHGWGIAGTKLSEEIAKLPVVEGVTLHCIARHDFMPFCQEEWDNINIGYCFFEHDLLAFPYISNASRQWDHIVAGSHWCEQILRKGGMERTSTILQGIDPIRFSMQPARNEDGRFIVFSGGKFEFRKGQDIVIAAMRVFMERHSDVWLSCAWHNAWPKSLKTMTQSKHIDFSWHEAPCDVLLLETLTRNGLDPSRVLLHPPFDNSRMPLIYSESDVGLFPNRCEGGNNMVMCEYMACGRSVVASTWTGHADVITPHNAFCLTSGQPVKALFEQHETGTWFEPSINNVVEQLESAYHDKKTRISRGIQAAQDMRQLSWKDAARQFHEIAAHLSDAARGIYGRPVFKTQRDIAESQFASGDLDAAESGFRRLLLQSPLDAELYNCLATVLDSQGKYNEAVAYYHKATALKPDLTVARYNLSNSLRRAGDEMGALQTLLHLTADFPNFLEAWKNLAMLYVSRESFAEAASCFDKIVALAPDDIESRCALGTMYSEIGFFKEAVECFEVVLAIQPDHITALESLGSSLHELDQLDRAEYCFRKALEREPEKVSILNNLGTVLRSMLKPDEAIKIFERALALDPDNGHVRFNRAMSRLALEELPWAWEDYEARFETRVPTRLYHAELPRWEGEPLKGHGLLVQSEQGFGDTFQFVRYLPLLSEAGGPVVFECQNESVREALVGLDNISIIARGEPLPPVSLQIPLASLPRLFGTTLATIPFASGYLKAPPHKDTEWRERLASDKGLLKVGLVWGGNKYSLNANRSMQLIDLEPVLAIPDISFYSLQVGHDAQQLSTLAYAITDLGTQFRDFGDTAAVINNLDLVISIDTAVAHLAGALGAPTWVMLKHSPDWRWFLERHDSPWYVTAKLFRQREPGDWAEVTKEVARELKLLREKKAKVCESPSDEVINARFHDQKVITT